MDAAISQMEKIVVQCRAILKKYKKQKDLENVESLLQKIQCRETNVLVCGEFKRGKSSFINAFLEEYICPIDVGIATATVSVLKYGDKVKVTRQYGDLNNLKTEEYDSLDQIDRYARGSAESIDNTVMLIIEIPNPKLKSGIVLFDTPGIGGLDPRHAFLTNYFLPKADITLFVTDMDSPMTAAEIDFFEKKIASYSKQYAILINKSDKFRTLKSQEEWINDIKTKCPAAKVIIPVSSKLKNDYLQSKDTEDLHESNFEIVENNIYILAADFKKALLIELKKYIIQLLNEVLSPIKTQIEQIKVPDPNLISKFEKELAIYKKQKDDLANPASEYRQKLESIIRKTKNEVEVKLQDESIILSSTHLKELATSAQARSNPKWLLEQINNGVGSIAAELDCLIDDAFDNVIAIIGNETIDDSSRSKFKYSINVDLTPEEKSLGTIACNTARHSLPAVGIFSLVAGLASVVFTGGATLPLLLGGATALGFVGKNMSDASKTNDAAYFQNKLAPEISRAMTHLRGYINLRFDDFNRQLLIAFQENAQKLIDNMDSIISNLTKLKTETAQQLQLKSKILNEEIKPIEQLLSVTNLFLSNPFEKKEKSGTPIPDAVENKDKGVSNDDKTMVG